MAELTLQELSRRFQNFNAEQEADVIIMRNGEFAIRMNQNQLLDGEDSNDSEITPNYKSAMYAAFKNSKNSRPGFGTPDLRNTGRFQDLMKFIKKGNQYFVTSIDEKTGMLVTKYGEDIFGLQKINSQSFRNKNDNDFNKEVEKLFK